MARFSILSAEMNATAKKLGLNATHYVNPNGLFDPRQLTSARDIGVLAAVILSEFPEHSHRFSQQHVAIGKKKLLNRNSLIRSMPEADGMKTGFVCNSGFNLVASATRDGRKLIAVVSGRAQFGKPLRNCADASDGGIFERNFAKPPAPGADFRHSAGRHCPGGFDKCGVQEKAAGERGSRQGPCRMGHLLR